MTYADFRSLTRLYFTISYFVEKYGSALLSKAYVPFIGVLSNFLLITYNSSFLYINK